jgi:HAD superfamily hydrolase (TIGR01484 family)
MWLANAADDKRDWGAGMNFVFDLDGTICFKGKPVTAKLLAALERLEAKGHTVFFASARPIRDMLPVLDQRFHRHTLIGGNGSLVSRRGELERAVPFSPEQREALQQLLKEHEATFLIDGEWDYTYTGAADHPILANVDPSRLAKRIGLEAHKAIVKVLILTSNDMEGLAKKAAELGVVVHRHGKENVLDVSPPDVDKWGALEGLAVKKGGYVAFGNDANDITLFMNAKHSVMIGHHDELSQYAAEALPLGEDIEDRIAERLNKLSEHWAAIEEAGTHVQEY